MTDDLRDRFGVTALHLPNAWDSDLENELPEIKAPADRRFTLVHTGKLTGPRGRDPRALFRAIERLVAENPSVSARLRLLLVGPQDETDVQALGEHHLEDVAVSTGLVPHAESLAHQRAADALLLLTSRDPSQGSAKLVEYLFSGTPIIALAEGNEPAEIVQETGTGVTVSPHDVDAIAEALRSALSGDLKAAYKPRDLEKYSYGPLALALEHEIETAIDQRLAKRDARQWALRCEGVERRSSGNGPGADA